MPEYITMSSLAQRIQHSPKNNNIGHWASERGNSVFQVDDPSLREFVERYGQTGISYSEGIPDFSPFTTHPSSAWGTFSGEVKVGHMNNRISAPLDYGLRRSKEDKYMLTEYLGNYEQADTALAQKLSVQCDCSVDPCEVAAFRKENQLTWHECSDMETMQLIPTRINSSFKHMGGTSEAKSLSEAAYDADPIEMPDENELHEQTTMEDLVQLSDEKELQTEPISEQNESWRIAGNIESPEKKGQDSLRDEQDVGYQPVKGRVRTRSEVNSYNIQGESQGQNEWQDAQLAERLSERYGMKFTPGDAAFLQDLSNQCEKCGQQSSSENQSVSLEDIASDVSDSIAANAIEESKKQADNVRSLSDEQMKQYAERFQEDETFAPEEVEGALKFEFYPL